MATRIITGVVAVVVLAVIVVAGILMYDTLQNFQHISVAERHLSPSEPVSYSDVKSILDQRCVVCHGCYDAPCQLKLTAWEGIMRGGHVDPVYNGQRMIASDMTRLFIDAHSTDAWRAKGFHAVVAEKAESLEETLASSVLYQLLKLKEDNPLPNQAILPDSFDFSLNRTQHCSGIEKFGRYAEKNALAGMPYGLPGLTRDQFDTIAHWLAQGANAPAMPVLPEFVVKQVNEWEKFLNGDDNKAQLVNRYIYEHWFLAHLYFENDEKRHYFQLVRSFTPPGQPINVIASRRPFDDPGIERVYYRLQPIKETILSKTHMPYALSAARMKRIEQWFYTPDYQVELLPSYAPEIASNPFKAFEALPVNARYQLMLDEAQFTIMGFIKGPVCRGQVALNVINDQFWVFFVSPEFSAMDEDASFLSRQSDHLRLPAEDESNVPALASWQKYAGAQRKYLEAKNAFIEEKVKHMKAIPLEIIWNGEDKNDNAALTVFRHFDNATVVKGLLGNPPQTAWLISYSLLERIHYLLVAGFDVYGNLGHQLHTRLYMDFLRMEGEANFLALLPHAQRVSERNLWYRGAFKDVQDYLQWEGRLRAVHADMPFDMTSNAKLQLYTQLQKQLRKVISQEHAFDKAPSDIHRALTTIQNVKGEAVAILPQVMQLVIAGNDVDVEYRYYSLLNNSAYSNISHVFLEENRRLPNEDSLTVARGIISAYPNVFFKVQSKDLMAFAQSIAMLTDETSYQQLLNRFAVRRTDPAFWLLSDKLHEDLRLLQPIEAGLLDYNRLENR